MTNIISLPKTSGSDSQGFDKKNRFGYFETMNFPYRKKQEDALAWHVFSQQELIPEGTSAPLSPIEIGYRLWTSYQLLDQPGMVAGTTASTTVYDGKGNLITATLADAVAFAVIYDKKGDVLGVSRLTQITHKPTNSEEKKRLIAVGGKVWDDRVEGMLAVSRAIGDTHFKSSGVCSEANIDITSVSKIIEDLKINPNDIGLVQIITTCDGFTDGAGYDNQSKESHEKYLFNALKKIKSPGVMAEEKLAKQLVQRAKSDSSQDNISVAVQTVPQEPAPINSAILIGLYDGHGGKEASCHVAKNMGQVFKEQCALTPSAYAQQKLSVNNKNKAYIRDNPKSGPDSTQEKKCTEIIRQLLTLTQEYQRNLDLRNSQQRRIKPVIEHLITLLTNDEKEPQDRIKVFYTFLNKTENNTLPGNEPKKFKNIDVIKLDTTRPTADFLLGIALIAATLCTFILPGLLIIGIVYFATGKHPFDLLKTKSERFEKELDLVKEKNKPFAAFFQPEKTNEEIPREVLKPDSDLKP